jgi:hypothetical protein
LAVGVAWWSELVGRQFRHVELLSTEKIDVFVSERGQAFHVVVAYLHFFLSEFAQYGVHISGVPQHDHVDDKSEGIELVFLSLSIALAKLPAVSVENVPCEGVAAFCAVEWVRILRR